MEKIKYELFIIFMGVVVGLIPYAVIAVILGIFKDGPTYDHWLPLSIGGLTALVVWFFGHLDMR